MIPQKAQDAKSFVLAASPIASRNRMREVAKRVRRYKRWLNRLHPYNNDIIDTLKQQPNVDPLKLGEYIASSAPLHLADGWNYLSRAFEAASRGDRSAAYHLGYYAELRAAMSLLATEGIGIFNDRHIALDDQLQPTEFRRSTHIATWLVLSAWSNETGRASILLEGITVESKSLSEWLQAVGVVAPAQQFLADKWLRAWSIDLDVFSNDRFRRNEMSYRPTRVRFPMPSSVNPRQEQVAPIFDSWSELEPLAGGTSAALDLSLLREALHLVVDEGQCNYASYGDALASLKSLMLDATYEALSSANSSADAIFRAAETESGKAKGMSASPILARGLLMLRLASASTASLLAIAQVSKSDLEFWWAPLGADLGLWHNPDDIDRFSDLWTDVVEAKVDAEEQISEIQGEGTVRTFAGILSRDVSLTQFSRAPMWLLGLD